MTGWFKNCVETNEKWHYTESVNNTALCGKQMGFFHSRKTDGFPEDDVCSDCIEMKSKLDSK